MTAMIRGMGVATGLFTGMAASRAFAAFGFSDPGQIGFQNAASEIAADIHWFHDWLLLPVTTIISLFVLGLLICIVVKFNDKANPVASKTTHHTGLEVAWTIIPVMILVVISIPSFKLLNKQLIEPKADVTVKVTGKQWYWSYDYPKDQAGGFNFDSSMKPEKDIDLAAGDKRLLSVDNEAVVPVGMNVRFEITAADVIHSFVVQSLGIRMDAVPGRLNSTWFKADREGLYYGQCSKICGKDHAYMPIAVRVVSAEKYAAWLSDAKKKYAAGGGQPLSVAFNEAPVEPR